MLSVNLQAKDTNMFWICNAWLCLQNIFKQHDFKLSVYYVSNGCHFLKLSYVVHGIYKYKINLKKKCYVYSLYKTLFLSNFYILYSFWLNCFYFKQANNAAAIGDVMEAERQSSHARTFVIASVIAGIIIITLVVVSRLLH